MQHELHEVSVSVHYHFRYCGGSGCSGDSCCMVVVLIFVLSRILLIPTLTLNTLLAPVVMTTIGTIVLFIS